MLIIYRCDVEVMQPRMMMMTMMIRRARKDVKESVGLTTKIVSNVE